MPLHYCVVVTLLKENEDTTTGKIVEQLPLGMILLIMYFFRHDGAKIN